MRLRGVFLIAAAVLLTGCSGAPASSSATTTASASATTKAPVQLLGSQLVPVLLPKSVMPARYSLITSAAQDSGQAKPHDTPAQVPSGNNLCIAFASSYFLPATGIQDSTYAQNGYSNSGDTAEVDQSIDVYADDDAQAAMQKLWAAFGSCANFTYTDQGTTLNTVLTRSALTGIGDQAVEAVTKSGIPGGSTLIAVRVSNSIITIADSSPSADDGLAAALGYARQLTTRLRSAAAG